MTTRLVRPPRLLGFGGRPYNFFDREAISSNLSTVLQGKYSAVLLAEGALVLADDEGYITFTDANLQVVLQHQVMGGGKTMLLARSFQNPPLIVVAGTDAAAGGASLIKTWVASKVTSPANVIDIAAQLKGTYKLELTALACNYDGTKIVVGFRSGLVLLFEGEFAKDKAKLKPPTTLRGAVGDHPVSGLHFMNPPDSGKGEEVILGSNREPVGSPKWLASNLTATAAANLHKLYVVLGSDGGSENGGGGGAATGGQGGGGEGEASAGGPMTARGGVLVYNTAELARPVVLDEQGASVGCSGVDHLNQDLVIGRPDAMYFYSEEEGRKGALGFEVRQRLCTLIGSSVLVATIDEQSGRSIINVYDLRNKFVAFNATLAVDQRVSGLVAEGSVAYVITSQGNVFRLREKEVSAKIKNLAEDMKLYGVAIKLAYSSNYDVGKIMEIYKLYGNYLYDKKRAYDDAIKQYCHTIGYLDPSYVISRFLDAQRIKNLTEYLEALHRRGHATADLTTFLLNCYTKLKDVEKLDQFIHPEKAVDRGDGEPPVAAFGLMLPPLSSSAAAAGGGGESSSSAAATDVAGDNVNTASSRRRSGVGTEAAEGAAKIDIETAIGVLKGAGYLDHALELARKYRAHEWYLKIQLEKASPSYRDALSYISSLSFHTAEQHMRTYGKKLMQELPEETTGVIMALCTGRFRANAKAISRKREADGTASTVELSIPGPDPNQRAKAENFIHLFVDHPGWLRTFLECVMKEPGISVSTTVANTLLELMVQDWEATLLKQEAGGGGGGAGGGTNEEAVALDRRRKKREGELMAFLEQHHGRYDEDQALVLVQMHRFKPGQLFLYDKMRNVDLVLDYYIAEGDTAAVLNRIGRKENKKNPDLWLKVLTYVVDSAKPKGEKPTDGGGEDSGADSDSDDEEAIWDDTMKVLQMIEREQVLPPHMVIDILSRNENIPLFVVREYISRLLKEAYADVNSSQAMIDSLRRSTTEKRAEVEDLRSTARLFQTTTCNSCRRPLELPAVHFLCMHSYHLDQNCINQESECNECASDHHHYERIKLKDQSGKALEHELFFSEMEEHGYAAVASYFGKGVLNVGLSSSTISASGAIGVAGGGRGGHSLHEWVGDP